MSRLRRSIPVQPLSDEAWSRVEEEVLAALEDAQDADAPDPARSPRWRLAAAASAAFVAAVASAVGLLWLLGAPEPAVPELASYRVQTAESGSRTELGDVLVSVQPDTALTALGSPAQGWRVALESGGATFAVPPRAGRPPFVVHAGTLRAEVVGTRFHVRRRGAAARVEVLEGVVEVTVEGRVQRVAAGGAVATAEWDAAPDPPAPVRADDEAEREAAAAAAPEVDRPSRRPSTRRTPAPGAARPDPEPRVSDREIFEEASRLEATDPRAARERYLSLARRSGPWAANALFAAGRLAVEQGRRAEARRSLTRYLSDYPRGPNAEDARALLARLPDAPR
jgi:hypothetical protein